MERALDAAFLLLAAIRNATQPPAQQREAVQDPATERNESQDLEKMARLLVTGPENAAASSPQETTPAVTNHPLARRRSFFPR